LGSDSVGRGIAESVATTSELHPTDARNAEHRPNTTPDDEPLFACTEARSPITPAERGANGGEGNLFSIH
jgi:hypothetical protein